MSVSHSNVLIHFSVKITFACKTMDDNTPNRSKNVLQIFNILRLVGERFRTFVAIS